MKVRVSIILFTIFVVVIFTSGCIDQINDVFGNTKNNICDGCKSKFKEECNKCPEGVHTEYITVDAFSSKCVEQCYGISIPLATNCNDLREICNQIF